MATTRKKKKKSTFEETVSNLSFGAAPSKDIKKRFLAAIEKSKAPVKTAPQAIKTAAEYFDECYKREVSPTVTGLAQAFGISRRQLRRYECKDEKLRAAIKAAKNFVQNHYEELMVHGRGSTPGVIFALKQLDWTDKQEIEHTGAVAIIAVDEEDL